MDRLRSNRFKSTMQRSAVVVAMSSVIFSCSASMDEPFETRATRLAAPRNPCRAPFSLAKSRP